MQLDPKEIEELAKKELHEETFRQKVEYRKATLKKWQDMPWYKRLFPWRMYRIGPDAKYTLILTSDLDRWKELASYHESRYYWANSETDKLHTEVQMLRRQNVDLRARVAAEDARRGWSSAPDSA